jgi:hypothetical protein
MPIDKIIPRFLVSDKDERLLKEGAMTDALNVTISEDGKGTEGVLKNVKGTNPVNAFDPSHQIADADPITAIGQVSDPQRGFIYYFVADDSNGNQHAIYQHDTSTNTYKIVAKGSAFGFQSGGFIKADLVNGDFARDGSIETIIYFTDNNNIPRKINVDRALAGEYGLTSTSTYHFSLSAMRASLNTCPVVRFETDESITQNGFIDDYFQFATQLLYIDGEESAISPYSELTVPSIVFNKTLDSKATSRTFQNVCVINPKYKREIVNTNANGFNVDENRVQPSTGIPDVEFIRLLARRGSTGPFFIIDDLPVSSNKSKEVYGETRNVWNHTTGEYKFYNDIIKSFVETSLVDKMYDNVPQKAQGQSIVGNRLIYSNYVEGYANGDEDGNPVKAKVSVDYFPPGTTLSEGGTGTVFDEGGTATNGDIVFDIKKQISWPNGATATDTVPAGSLISLSARWSPEGTVKGTTTDGIVSVNFFVQGIGAFVAGLCPSGFSSASDDFHIGDQGPNGGNQLDLNIPISADFRLDQDMTLDAIAEEFKSLISPQEVTIEYDHSNPTPGVGDDVFGFRVTDALSSTLSNGDFLQVNAANIRITFAFDDISDPTANDGSFVIKPYIKKIIFTEVFFLGTGAAPFGYPPNLLSETEIEALHTMNAGSTPLSQNDQTFAISNQTAYIASSLIDVSTEVNYSTFKAGCSHDFGVVYYDRYNRSGFVNEIGSAYVTPLSQRASGKEGRAEIKVTMDCNPPPWAAKWQLVYGGISSFSDFFQYTTGGGYVPTQPGGTGNTFDPDEDKREVYVSLKTLDLYRSEKSANRNYSFTEGDILRVVSYVDNSGTRIFPSSNDPNKPIEFNVLRVEVLGDSDNPIQLHNPIEDDQKGTFLVLGAPEVSSGVKILNSSGTQTGLKYDGFDWFSISESLDFNGTLNFPYPDGNASSGNNYWGQQCIVEILTPSRSTENKVYYEIGEPHDIFTVGSNPERFVTYSTKHGPPITTRNGDTFLRLVACKTPILSDPANVNWSIGTNNTNTPTGDGSIRDVENFDYVDLEIESLQVSDTSYTKDWSKGRAHSVFKDAAANIYKNGLVYGDAYVEGNKQLSYSSFNPSLGNFETLDIKFGSIEYIGNYNDDLAALQENKMCLIPVNKNILEYASGSSDVAVSTNVLGQRRYSSGDYGSGGHPEAVIIQDNTIYFVDESRQAVLSLTGGQLVPISEKNMSSFFENFFTTGHTKYVSGYDPRDNTYYLTGIGGSSPIYKTVGYDAARGGWQSRYSFRPDLYANQNNMLYSAKYVDATTDLIFHEHSDFADHNTFYGTKAKSEVQVVSKLSPSRVKVFNAISYEGDSNAWEMSTGATTSLNQTSGIIHDAAGSDTPKFVEKEGAYYAAMPKDTAVKYVYAGTFDSVSSNDITVTDIARLDRFPFFLDQTPLYYLSGGTYNTVSTNPAASTVTGFNLSASTITTTVAAGNPSNGDKLFFQVSTDGDAMRGSFMKVTLTLPTIASPAEQELYCINTHITDSKSHHPLGQ